MFRVFKCFTSEPAKYFDKTKDLLFIWWLTVCLLIATLLSCEQTPPHKKITKVNYDSVVVGLLQKVGDLTDQLKLIDHEEFISVYNDPLVYFDDASRFVADNNHSFQEKAIAIFSMRNLPLKKYIEFCTHCKELSDQKIIEQSLFEIATSASFEESSPIIKNWNNEDVKKFLNSVYTDKNITGKYKDYIKELTSK